MIVYARSLQIFDLNYLTLERFCVCFLNIVISFIRSINEYQMHMIKTFTRE